MLRNEDFAVQLHFLSSAPGVAALLPVGEIVSNAGVLGRAFACIGICRVGLRARIAYCLVRTDALEISTDSHTLLLLPD